MWDDSATAPFLAKDVDKFYKADIYENALEAMQAAEPEQLEDYIREKGMPMGKVMNCIRLGLSGAASGLGIADILRFIGKKEGVARMRYMKERLG